MLGTVENPHGAEELFEYLEGVFFFKKDRSSRFTGANRSFVQLCGLESEGQLLGKTDMDFFPEHMAQRYMGDDRWVMETGRALAKTIEVNAGPGGVKWLQTSKVPLIEGGSVVGLAGVARDVRRSLSTLQPYDDLRPALDEMEADQGGSLTMQSLASKIGLSLSQFERRFKRCFSMTPKQYVLQLRLDNAAQALEESSRPISTIAQDFGFHDQSHFSRQFKVRFGQTPLQHRQGLRSKSK